MTGGRNPEIALSFLKMRSRVTILGVAALFALMAFAVAAKGGAPGIGDIAGMASAYDDARAVGTNRVGRKEVHDALLSAWRDGSGEGVDGAIPLEGVSFPLSSYPDGSVRIQFKAATATLPPDEDAYVRGHDIHAEMFRPDGSLEGIFLAEHCIMDRKEHAGYCDGRIRLQYRNLKIVGTNLLWDVQAQDVVVMDGVRVTVNRLMGGLGKAFRK